MATSIPDATGSTNGDDDGDLGGSISMAPPRRKLGDDELRMRL